MIGLPGVVAQGAAHQGALQDVGVGGRRVEGARRAVGAAGAPVVHVGGGVGAVADHE